MLSYEQAQTVQRAMDRIEDFEASPVGDKTVDEVMGVRNAIHDIVQVLDILVKHADRQ